MGFYFSILQDYGEETEGLTILQEHLKNKCKLLVDFDCSMLSCALLFCLCVPDWSSCTTPVPRNCQPEVFLLYIKTESLLRFCCEN